MTSAPESFAPRALLRNPHVQTVLGSRGRQRWVQRRAQPLLASAEETIVTTSEGVRLQAIAHLKEAAPTIILIHGWLGHADSSYVLSTAAELWTHGFSVIRLNLRDHGETAHLNEDLFHSARTREVVDAVAHLQQSIATGPVGLLGFSLGGNFVLRVGKATSLPALAVCPVLDPAASMRAIDDGWIGYRWFFVRKWRRALRAKQAAFPHRYDFSRALQLNTVSTLTDLFVREHTEYPCSADYLQRYTLTGDFLAGTRSAIVYAEDDPVIPNSGFRNLPESVSVLPTRHGGHCAFVSHPAQPSWVDTFAVQHFAAELSAQRLVAQELDG